MDLQTYVIWKYGIGGSVLPSEFSECLQHAKSIKQFIALVRYCDNH